MARHGDAEVLAKVMACLEDPNLAVRSTGFWVLGALAEKGDKAVLKPLGSFFADARGDVRSAAAAAFLEVAVKGDALACMTAAANATHSSAEVRRLAISTLAAVSQ